MGGMDTAALLSLFDVLPLLDAQGRRVLRETPPSAGPQALLRALVERGALTGMQANWLLSGRGTDLILGPFVLLDRLGEGGMGVVFRARHRELGRVQAVKLLNDERRQARAALERFKREGQAAAALQHPNIVAIHDAGEAGGRFFLALEYVAGKDLGRVVGERGPLPIGEACGHVRQAAEAMQHAHERGLIHRDIKPANLLLTPEGVVKVADLGLAAYRQAAETQAQHTPEGALLGTPDFLAPEQARDARSADIRADVYSLGATLYFLLTGRPPFAGGSITEKLLRHQSEPPARPDGLPDELWAVLSATLAKGPAGRPATPGELAALLTPFCSCPDRAAVAHEPPPPIPSTVRPPPGPTVLMSETPPRRPWWPVPAAVLALGLVALAAWILWPRGGGGRRDDPPAAKGARRAWHPPELVAVLGDDRWRHWGVVEAIAADAAGKRVVSRGDDGKVRIWDAATGEAEAILSEAGIQGRGVAISPDGEAVAAGGAAGVVWVWRGPEWKATRFRDHPEVGHVDAVAFLADGELMSASRVGGVRVREVFRDDLEPKQVDGRPVGDGTRLAASGGRAALGDEAGGLRLFAWPPVGAAPAVATRRGPVLGVAIGAGRVATAHKGGAVGLWDALSGKSLGEAATHKGDARCVALSGDGKWLASGGWDATVLLHDLAAGRPAGELDTGWQRIEAVAFLPGPALLVGGEEGYIGLWGPDTRKPLRKTGGHTGPVRGLALLADGRLATGADDRVIRVWDLTTGQAREIPADFPGDIIALAAFPDGLLAAGGKDESVHLYDTAACEKVGELPVKFWVYTMSPLPGGRLLLGGKSARAEVWDVKTRKRVEQLPPHRDNLKSSASEGENFATGDGSYEGRATARVHGGASYPGHAEAVSALALGGGVLASGDRAGVLRLDGKPAGEKHEALLSALAWSPDGKRLASACLAGEVMWRDAAGKRLGGWRFPGAVMSLRVTADGRHLVTGNADGTAFVLRVP